MLGKKKLVSYFCAYCGTDKKETTKTTTGVNIFKNIKIPKDKRYFMILCPACNTIIDTTIL